jgi:tRNA(Ile)-lysidine synthase
MKILADIHRQVRRTIEAYGMMNRGDRVVVAVSGGPDSVALLYLLWELRRHLGIRLHVAHLDHGLRGADSRRDVRYVRRLARRLGLPVTVKSVRIPLHPDGGIEEAARTVRYGFLAEVAAERRAERIATGHTADDQAETVLMRLIRGAGSEGLAGIPPLRGDIVRPLIEVRRSQIERFLRQRRLRPRQDGTNRQLERLRNQVRWELIPLLERKYQPNIVKILNRIARLESEERDYFRSLAGELLDRRVRSVSKGKIILDLSGFGDYFSIGQKYLLRELIRRLKGDLRGIESHHLEQLIDLARKESLGSRLVLPHAIMVERTQGGLIFVRERSKSFCQRVKLPGVWHLHQPGWTFRSRLIEKDSDFRLPDKKDEYRAFLDWSRMRGPFVFRNRRPGDRFHPLGMGGSRKLSDYFIDRKIPRVLRDDVPLLVGRDGIIWVVGSGIGEPFKVSQSTTWVLSARCSRGAES